MNEELTATEIQTEIEATVAEIEASKQELVRLEADEPTDGKGLTLYVETKARVSLLSKKRERLESELGKANLADLKRLEEQADADSISASQAAQRLEESITKAVRRDYEPQFEVGLADIVRCNKKVIASQSAARAAQGHLMQTRQSIRNFYRENPSIA